MRGILALSLALLSGCATTYPVATDGTDSAVTVNWARSTEGVNGALAAAEAHCSKYGKRAQFVGKITTFQLSYNCVKPT